MLLTRMTCVRVSIGLVLCCPTLPARATTVRVPADQPTIQAAINVTSHTDTVLVADGTYTGAGNRNLSFGGRNIVVRSTNGPLATIIDAQHAARAVVFNSAETLAARLQGFTITGGISSSAGGGIYIVGSSPTIADCVIRNNSTQSGAPGTSGVPGGSGGRGAGVCVDSGAPTLERCTIAANVTGNGGAGFVNGSGPGGSDGGDGGRGGGVFVGAAATVLLRDCVVRDNGTGSGGQGGSSVICVPPLSCQTFGEDGGDGGDGGGIFVAGVAQASNCVFIRNVTGQGGAAGFGVDPPLPAPGRGGNGAAWGGGTALSVAVNCSFTANTAAAAGGAGQPAGTGGGMDAASVTTNSIFWANAPNQVSPAASVSYCDVQGGFAGVGNLAADPLFENAPNDDLRLQASSPCIDAGSNPAVPPGVVTDLDGLPRITDGNGDSVAVVDMGVYEYVDLTDVSVPGLATRAAVVSVQESPASVTIRYRIDGPGGIVRLDFYDIAGRRLRTLEEGWHDAGVHSATWDRRTWHGNRVARGAYMLVLRAGDTRVNTKLIVLQP
jgi:hypothetical protein